MAARTLDNTRAQIAIMRPDPQATAMRQIVADLLTTNPDVNRYFGEMISGVTTRYDLGDEDPLDGAGDRRRDLGVDLVGGHLEQRLVDLDLVADLLEPAGDGALGDALAQGGHRHGVRDQLSARLLRGRLGRLPVDGL